jgi:uroporphyrinogen-III synthase
MVVPGVALLLTGIAYYFFTEDAPDGNFQRPPSAGVSGAFRKACRDRRVWALAVLYAACLGIELTIDNFAALYFTDYFHLTLKIAGVVAGTFGMMNLFARALGGFVSDRVNRRWGLHGRTRLLAGTIAAEGFALMLFSQARWLPFAIASMLLTGLFVKMSNGATYSVVPFVNKRALGAVAGIVGAGGNFGAMLAGKYGGEPFVAPSVQERALEDQGEPVRFVERLEAGDFDMVICMTGAGLTFLRDVLAPHMPAERLGAALRRATIVSRGPKPMVVLRALGVPVHVLIPEPNTWKEIVVAVAGRPERRIAVQEYGRPNLEMNAALERLGASVTPMAFYRWELPENVEPLREAARRLAARSFDVVLLRRPFSSITCSRSPATWDSTVKFGVRCRKMW